MKSGCPIVKMNISEGEPGWFTGIQKGVYELVQYTRLLKTVGKEDGRGEEVIVETIDSNG